MTTLSLMIDFQSNKDAGLHDLHRAEGGAELTLNLWCLMQTIWLRRFLYVRFLNLTSTLNLKSIIASPVKNLLLQRLPP